MTLSPLPNSQKGENRTGERWKDLQQNKIGAQAREMETFMSRTIEEKTIKESKSFITASSQEKGAGILALAKDMYCFSLMSGHRILEW